MGGALLDYYRVLPGFFFTQFYLNDILSRYWKARPSSATQLGRPPVVVFVVVVVVVVVVAAAVAGG